MGQIINFRRCYKALNVIMFLLINIIYMEKRAVKRISTNLKVKFCCCSTDDYYGTVTNLSENGMFITTQMCFPLETSFDIDIFSDTETLKVPVVVRWVRKSGRNYNGVGVKVTDPHPRYVNFVERLNSL